MKTFNQSLLLVWVSLVALSCQGNNEGDIQTDKSDSSAAARIEYLARIELLGRDSVSVLELLEESHRVDYKSSAMGVFVTAIDGQPESGQAYWVYQINDTTPRVACDKVLTRTGDSIVWYLQPQ